MLRISISPSVLVLMVVLIVVLMVVLMTAEVACMGAEQRRPVKG